VFFNTFSIIPARIAHNYTYNIRAIAYGSAGNRFVAAGNSGKMAYFTDGVTWTAVANSTFGSLYGRSSKDDCHSPDTA